MVKVPRPSQKIFYNLFLDTFRQEFVQNSESLEVGAQKFLYSGLYWFLVNNSMELIALKKVTFPAAVEKFCMCFVFISTHEMSLVGTFATIYFFVNYLRGGAA